MSAGFRSRLLLLLAALPGPLAAQCSVTATSVAFGAYDVFAPMPLTSTGRIEWYCAEPGLAVQLQLGTGQAATFRPRQMTKGADRLAYNLYLDPAASRIWGDGSEGTFTFLGTAAPGPPRTSSIPVYGVIPPGQDASPGLYTDEVTVTVFF